MSVVDLMIFAKETGDLIREEHDAAKKETDS